MNAVREDSLEFRLDRLVPAAPDFVDHQERSFELLADVIGDEEDCTLLGVPVRVVPAPSRPPTRPPVPAPPVDMIVTDPEEETTQEVEVIELDASDIDDLTIDIDETLTVPLPLYRHPVARKSARAAGLVALGALWVAHVAAVAALVLT